MLFRFNRGVYALIFLGLLVWVPWYVMVDIPTEETALAFVLVIASLSLNVWMCQDGEYGYVDGLENLSRRYGSIFVNAALLYLIPLFFLLHLLATALSVIGIFVGRPFTIAAWGRLTERGREAQMVRI